ncbi:CHAT domain-containing protein [Aquimarina algiphila]|uniref:CHAT domain-containing protein n=1 Tax=Aquimarina algiphila TaxID=2047982 RepID=UPI0024910387|nr:tetratricopeptide repeat protein [Aquimarina algiphila]
MIERLIFLYIVFCFFISSGYSQTPKDTIVASQYYKKADSLLKERKHEESILFLKKALPLYKKVEVWKKVAGCYNKISENQWRTRKSEKSIKNSRKALEISNKYLAKGNREESNSYDNIGNYYENISNYDKALEYYKKALKIQQKLFSENHGDIAKSYNNIAIIYHYTAKYKKAKETYEKALAINIKVLGPDHPKTGNVYNNIGIVYKNLGKFNEAIEYYKKAVTIMIKNSGKDHVHVGSYYLNIGIAYNKLKDDNALHYYQKALQVYSKQKYLTGLSAIYQNFGVFYTDVTGEYDKALEYHKKGLDIALKYYGEHHSVTADIYDNLGIVFSFKGDYEKALYYYTKALQIDKVILGENHENVALLYGNIGEMYARKKEYDKALVYYKKSLKVRNIILDKNHPNITISYNSIAALYLEKKDYNNALKYYQKALDILRDLYGEEHLLTGFCYTRIAATYQEQKEYHKAMSYFNKALIANSKNKNSKEFKNVFETNNYYDSRLLLETFQGKAKALQSWFQQNSNREGLAQSITIYKHAVLVINSIRQSYQNYQDKVAFAKQAKEIYTNAINAHLLMHKETKDQSSLSQVFYYIEKSKANVLKELLNDSYAKNYTGLPDELVTVEKILKTNQAFYTSLINDEQSNTLIDTLKISELESELFDINRKQDSLTKVFEKEYPKYYQLKYKDDVVSISKIQEKLGDKITILEFFTTDSVTYAFTISKNDISVKELKTIELEKKVEELLESITSKNINEYTKTAYALYEKLITPIQDKLIGDELVIIPDGPLWHLNFELLLTQKDEAETRDMSYLLRDYAIYYANSSNLLFNPLQNEFKSSGIRNECLAFSFSDSTQLTSAKKMSLATLRDTGDDLPGTRKEIKAISNIVNGQYFYGSEAVESNFKENASQYNILHLALHGDIDNKNPQNSKLYFTKSKDTIEDNLLYSHELFALDIPAELAVLSACNTGTGKIAKGEGIMSLGNAFQYAGTKSLLLSGWEVSDKSTPVLIENFYKNLANGMNKAKALQQAKLDFIKTADFEQVAPFYWGSFYLLGNADPIKIDQPLSINIYWIIFICIMIVLSLAFVYYRKMQKFN